MTYCHVARYAFRWIFSRLTKPSLITALGFGFTGILAAPSEAWAWRHTRKHMDVCDRDFEWWVSDSPDTPDFAVDVISEAFTEWMSALPCDATHTFMGVREGHNAGYTFDYLNTFYFGDPEGEVSDGILAQTLVLGTATPCHQFADDIYVTSTDADLVFNDDINWLTPEEAADPGCEDGYNLKQIALQEIGHMLGLGHSCEEGETCSDPLKRDAVMYWAAEQCGASKNPNADDINGLRALWSGAVSLESPFWISGVVPFEYCLYDGDRESTEPYLDMEVVFNVDWGDGSLAVYDNEIPCHTYETPGEYIIEVDWTTELIDHPGHPNSGSDTFEAYVFPADEPGPGSGDDGSGGGDTTGGGDDAGSGAEDDASSESGGKGCTTASPLPSPWVFLALLMLILVRNVDSQNSNWSARPGS